MLKDSSLFRYNFRPNGSCTEDAAKILLIQVAGDCSNGHVSDIWNVVSFNGSRRN